MQSGNSGVPAGAGPDRGPDSSDTRQAEQAERAGDEADREGSDAVPEQLWDSERIVSDAIGRLMALWGFRRNMGRVWTVLYLAGEPLTARQLKERLQLSTGAVSMTLNELARWGVVHKSWAQGDRRDFFQAEANVWKMVSRVMRERERTEIVSAIEAFEDALLALDRKAENSTQPRNVREQVQRERIERLIELAKMGRTMLDALIESARLDVSWLARFRLGRGR